MEIQEMGEGAHRPTKNNAIVIAIIFIAIGLILIGRNTGVIDYQLYRILMSWQSLLIVLGLCMISRRNITSGLIVGGVGAFFLIPKITMASQWMHTYWPLVFVMVGVVLLFKHISRRRECHNRLTGDRGNRNGRGAEEAYYKSENGFVNSNVTFGSVRHIVIDPVFKGAILRSYFAGTVLDLRRTSLPEGDTYIELDCVFGGTELYIPEDWAIVSDVLPVFGGVDDKRFRPGPELPGRRLIIRGKVTFGGIEIKG